jgi:hypothetical protein
MFDEPDTHLPAHGVLLHIGPHKTGTTSIQTALHDARPAMAKHGVVYAGRSRQHQMAALAITGSRGLSGDRPPRLADWQALVDAVADAPEERVVVSSEFFDDARGDVAQRVVTELGGDRVHVVVTLRPLAKILPSAWQQYIRNRVRRPYDQWLDVMLNHPEDTWITPSFWNRHHHDRLVEEWASIVGPERLLVVVVDDADGGSLMRAFEQVLDLPSGLLQARRGYTNRSLTAEETELIRSINVAFHERGWPAKLYNDLIRNGLVKEMQRNPAPPDAPHIITPAWAVDRANEIAAMAAKRIEASGVRVLGDLSILSSVHAEPPDEHVAATDITVLPQRLQATIDLIEARLAAEALKPPAPTTAASPHADLRGPTVDEISTRDLIKLVLTRVRRRLIDRHRFKRLARLR